MRVLFLTLFSICFFSAISQAKIDEKKQTISPSNKLKKEIMFVGSKKTKPTPKKTKTAQLLYGSICRNGYFWCYMSAPGPVGASCFCPNAAGGFWGLVSTQ